MKFFSATAAAVASLVLAASADAAVLTYEATNAVAPPRADGSPGDNHSFFFNNATFTFTTGGSFVVDEGAGTASLVGFASDDSDPSGTSGLDIALYFDAVPWTATRTPKVEYSPSGLAAAGIVPTRDWSAYELVESGVRDSMMTVVGGIEIMNRTGSETYTFGDGALFDVFSKPEDGSHVFQLGKGANGKNLNFGMSGWFGFFSEGQKFCGDENVCDGNMDFALTTTVIPLPASILLFGGALGLLAGMRRRRG